MRKRTLPYLLLGLLLSGCILRTNGPSPDLPLTVTPARAGSATQKPRLTDTPIPSAAPTASPTPDLAQIGLPPEDASNDAFDFVSQMCDAQWLNRGQVLPCPGQDTGGSGGYVMSFNGEIQGLPSNLDILLTFAPSVQSGALFGRYPPFTVKSGDRFRAVLACRVHTFCDVEFGLEFYDAQGRIDLRHWPYLFADPPIVVDYPLEGLAGKTVQPGLSVMANGNSLEAYAVWIAPHIYRPIP
ncbi:MAG TPA: hypothetical protein VLZ89_02750 [Anaerolineales bacterium]|nr:hypothetical protein [Anaerolineales bacterium]